MGSRNQGFVHELYVRTVRIGKERQCLQVGGKSSIAHPAHQEGNPNLIIESVRHFERSWIEGLNGRARRYPFGLYNFQEGRCKCIRFWMKPPVPRRPTFDFNVVEDRAAVVILHVGLCLMENVLKTRLRYWLGALLRKLRGL